MKIACIGSREFCDYPLLKTYLDALIVDLDLDEPVEAIVTGGGQGADSLAEIYADDHGIGKITIPPDWVHHGKAAGALRNQLIVNEADIVVAFFVKGLYSQGVENTCSIAKKAQKTVYKVEQSRSALLVK